MALPLNHGMYLKCMNVSVDVNDGTGATYLVTFLDVDAVTQSKASVTFVTDSTNAALFTVGTKYYFDIGS